jgi:hypothetical protein
MDLADGSVAPDDQTPKAGTPTITYYQKLAAAMMSAMEDAALAVPGYLDDLSIARAGVRKSLPRDVIDMVVSAVEASPELTGVDALEVNRTRDTLQFSEAFRPAVSFILSVVKRLTLMMDVRESRAGRDALLMYSIARRLARNPDNTHIHVHVENIRTELRRRRIGRIMKPRQRQATVIPEAGGEVQPQE